MILVDTSVWIDHLRSGVRELRDVLGEGAALCHPFVVGELACGNLSNRAEILSLMAALPRPEVASHDEVLQLVSDRKLHGRGLGWIDMHLLAAATLTPCELWTKDGRLAAAARELGVATR